MPILIHRCARLPILAVLIALSLFLSREMAAQSYTVTNLGTLGGNFTNIFAVNNAGQVVGDSQRADGTDHAFLWQNGVMTDLGTLGGNDSQAYDINTSGQIVGELRSADGNYHAFLWQNGVMTDLGTLGGNYSFASGINNSGQIVGATQRADGTEHAFLWQNGVMTDLGTLGGNTSFVDAINNSGQVVGGSRRADGSDHAFLWQNGVMTDLGTLGGNYSFASGINNSGQIVGVTQRADGSYLGFLWQNDVMTTSDTLGFPNNIGNSGQIVCSSQRADGSYYASLWQNGVTQDLNSVLPPNSGWYLAGAININDLGQIVCDGTFNGQNRGCLLTPSTAVQISNLAVSQITLQGATVTWNTNVPTNSTVEYGPTIAYGNTVSAAALTTSHSVNLTGLSPLHIYHYRVRSTTPAGTTAVSADGTFVADNLPVFFLTYGNLRKDGAGNYLVDITFTNQEKSTIPTVNVQFATLNSLAATSPHLTFTLLDLPSGNRTVTFTFPSTVGKSGTTVALSVSGWTGLTFGSPDVSFFSMTARVTLP